MQLLLRQVMGGLVAVARGLPLAQYAKQPERTDAADGSPPAPRIKITGAVARAKRAVSAASKPIADRVQRHSQSEFKRLGINLRKEEPKLGKLIEAWRADNVERVTSLLEFERDELADILSKGEGKTVPELRLRIAERLDVSRAKADLLARDQVLTLNAQISKERQVAAGVTSYYWSTSNDERVRESHEAIDGERFDWDDPPDVDGEPAHPGEPVNCRCIAAPILPELDD